MLKAEKPHLCITGVGMWIDAGSYRVCKPGRRRWHLTLTTHKRSATH